jgi:hypothetical protein
MKLLCKAMFLWVLLIAAQQGAFVHELTHLHGASDAGLQVRTPAAADAGCALCPAYAQAAAPAFGHASPPPLVLQAGIGKIPAVRFDLISAAVPAARSRGPPALS